ncbi:MATE family efflux transporter [Methylobacterium planeticum]|uniref:MATE family efflux transporter n=1 Tax=Methylobacterium planeticum TaxID=2615211 RepID=A0A6N6MHZ3_9HYPH|nr:MATE family efflux transporter [Methylobacterium planeticum]KAB1069566.1 MATE family efflux transporter [Methylobacterium planeticum]
MDPRTRRLLQAPLVPTLLRLALPNILMSVVQASVGLIETYFVAGLGTDALAGMALVFPLLMLVQMVSAGAVGGGILSAVSRALGSGRRAAAGELVWYAVAIALGLGLLTTLLALTLGPGAYRAMGGRDGSLTAAVTYAQVVFSGAVLIWLFNGLAAVIRGAGNMVLPASVTCLGALVLIPLSPALIFGWGPLPHLGIVGGGVAVIGYYAAGVLVFAVYLWSGRGVLHPPARPPALAWTPAREVLRVGLVSALVSATTNVTIATATGLVGAAGPAAVAGYGTGTRLEYLLVPLVFGLGAPLAALVGTAIGAGDRERARRAAWIGAALAGLASETIGVSAALWPEAWLGLFGDDPAMLAVGTRYLRMVGPLYGFFGFGLALYFAAQGAGRVGWALAAGLVRVMLALGGGWLALRLGRVPEGVFLALGLGLVAVGLINAAGLLTGAWLPDGRRVRPAPLSIPKLHRL